MSSHSIQQQHDHYDIDTKTRTPFRISAAALREGADNIKLMPNEDYLVLPYVILAPSVAPIKSKYILDYSYTTFAFIDTNYTY